MCLDFALNPSELAGLFLYFLPIEVGRISEYDCAWEVLMKMYCLRLVPVSTMQIVRLAGYKVFCCRRPYILHEHVSSLTRKCVT